MDLNHVAGELADVVYNVTGFRDDVLFRLKAHILTALESIQAETVQRTLKRAAMAAPVLPSNWADWPSDRAIAFVRGWKSKHAAILALIDKPTTPNPTPAVTTGPNAEPVTLETAGRIVLELQDRVSELEAPDPLLVALAVLFADNWREIPLRMLIKAGLVDADYHAKLTELGKAAIALAEGGR